MVLENPLLLDCSSLDDLLTRSSLRCEIILKNCTISLHYSQRERTLPKSKVYMYIWVDMFDIDVLVQYNT